jgi:hypothetical protein
LYPESPSGDSRNAGCDHYGFLRKSMFKAAAFVIYKAIYRRTRWQGINASANCKFIAIERGSGVMPGICDMAGKGKNGI